MNQFHTVELELQRNLSLYKTCWDSIYLHRLDMACDPRNFADVAAVILQHGLAHVCLITPNMTLVRAKIEVNIPRKRHADKGDKALTRFYDSIVEAIQRHINFQVVKCVIVASPGYVAEDFMRYLFQVAVQRDLKGITDNKGKFVVAHSSSGHKHALREVLSDPVVASKISETKAFNEVRALSAFLEMLNSNPDRAFYGYNHVKRANDEKAIETLLVTDDLFRNADLATRQRYVSLVESVRENGGDVHVFSSLHVSGEQLSQMSGVAAVLRFPLLGIEDEDDEEEARALAEEKERADDEFQNRPPELDRDWGPKNPPADHLDAAGATTDEKQRSADEDDDGFTDQQQSHSARDNK